MKADIATIEIIRNQLIQTYRATVGQNLVWLRQYQIFQDKAAQRLAMFALGRCAGVYAALLAFDPTKGTVIPKDVEDINSTLNDYYESVAVLNPLDAFDAFVEANCIKPKGY